MATSAGRRNTPARLPAPAVPRELLHDVRELIRSAREHVAQAVNAGLTLLYWQVGDRIRREILKEKRAEYGQHIVSSLATKLEAEFGRGFGRRNLFRMIRFAEVFPDQELPAEGPPVAAHAAAFLQGLERLAWRRTAEGAGLRDFLYANLNPELPESALIWELYEEVVGHDSQGDA